MPSRNYVIGGVAIGLLCVAVFVAGGHPWSVTFGYTVWGAKVATALGFDLSQAAFWQWPGPKHALAEIRIVRHLEPHRFRHAVRRHGGGGSHEPSRQPPGRL